MTGKRKGGKRENMAKYEKKMMQFEAFKYTGDLSLPACSQDYDETKHAPEWAALAVVRNILFYDVSNPAEKPILCTRRPNGEIVPIPVGYYIIRWSDTELYPCEPNLFEASYVLVGEESEEKRCLNTQARYRMWEEKNKELEEAVKPLHKWLCKYGDPYVAVIVKQCGVQVFEGTVAIPLPVPD